MACSARTRPAGRRIAEGDKLRRLVDSWFTPRALAGLLGRPVSQTEKLAHARLRGADRTSARSAAAACGGGRGTPRGRLACLRRIAVAAECFREAWAIHGEIAADPSPARGGEALHSNVGLPVALNVGDFLLGEGYRLIAEAPLPPATQAAMLRAAARAHRALAEAAASRHSAGADSQAAAELAAKLGAWCADSQERAD